MKNKIVDDKPVASAQPNEIDWMNISNDFINVINDFRKITGEDPLPLAKPGIPTKKALADWENAYPGMSKTLNDMALREMNHRLYQKSLNLNRSNIFMNIEVCLLILLCVSAGLFGAMMFEWLLRKFL